MNYHQTSSEGVRTQALIRDNVRAMGAGAALLYDRDCELCRWSVATVLRHDGRRALRPVAIQSSEGEALLASVPRERRLDSWHLALDGGRVHSGAEVLTPLLELLNGSARARVIGRIAGPMTHSYRGVANRRSLFGPLVSRGALRRADLTIRERFREDASGAPPIVSESPASQTEAPEHDGAGAAVSAFVSAAGPPVIVPAEPPQPSPPPPAPPDQEPVGWQQRLEESAFGRGVISTLLIVTVIAVAATNLPDSSLRRGLMQPGQPFLNALGLDQNWSVFAPDPRRAVLDVYALVTFEDGKVTRWHFPRNNSVIGSYRDYRWGKWQEAMIVPSNGNLLWRSAALWAAGREARPGHAVVRVTLMERTSPLAPPGAQPSVGPPQVRAFYQLVVRGPLKPVPLQGPISTKGKGL